MSRARGGQAVRTGMGRHVLVAAAVESRKVRASPVGRTVTVLLVGGVTLLVGALTAAALAGNPQILAQLGTVGTQQGWDLYLGVAAQITAAGGLVGFGVMLSWLIGREFADGTISALFALPISRGQVCAGKFGAYVAWALGVSVALTLVIALAGLALPLGPLDGAALAGLGRQLLLTVLTAGLAVPAAWVASLARSLLAGIGAVVGLVVIAQVGVAAGTGAWLPLVAPALWAFDTGAVSGPQLAMSLTVPVLFGALTIGTWRNLQLDR